MDEAKLYYTKYLSMSNLSERRVRYVFIIIALVVYVPLWIYTIGVHYSQIKTGFDVEYALPVSGSDSYEYRSLAENLLSKQAFTFDGSYPETFRVPGYPLFIAGIIFITKSYFGVTLIQILLAGITGYLIFLIGRKYFNNLVGVISGILYVLNIGVVTHSLVLLSDIPFNFFFIASVYLLLSKIDQFKSSKYMVLAGAFLGFAILIRPIAIFTPLLIVGILYLIHRRRLPLAIFLHNSIIFFLIVVSLFLLPWGMRNYSLTKNFSLSSLSAYNLFHYNIPEYISVRDNISAEDGRKILEAKLSVDERANQKSLYYSDSLTAVSKQFLKEDFLAYLAFHVVKTAPFFISSDIVSSIDMYNAFYTDDVNFAHKQANLSTRIINNEWGAVYRELIDRGGIFFEHIFWLCIVFLSVYAVIKSPYKSGVILFFVLVVYFAILTGPVSYSRYRLPAIPFLFLLATAGIQYAYMSIKSGCKKRGLCYDGGLKSDYRK